MVTPFDKAINQIAENTGKMAQSLPEIVKNTGEILKIETKENKLQKGEQQAKQAQKERDAADSGKKANEEVIDRLDTLIESVGGPSKSSNSSSQNSGNNNNLLQQVLNWAQGGAKKQTGGYVEPPVQHFATGGRVKGITTVPGNSTGDNHDYVLEPDTFILNREASKFLRRQEGGLVPTKLESGETVFPPGSYNGFITALNDLIPRFQDGGKVPENKPPAQGVKPAFPLEKAHVGTSATQKYGTARGRMHHGVDIVENSPWGDDPKLTVMATAPGKVLQEKYTTGDGYVDGFMLHQNDGYDSRYVHMMPSVQPGQEVSAGQAVGKLLDLGNDSHLHYELYPHGGGGSIDPEPYLSGAAKMNPKVTKGGMEVAPDGRKGEVGGKDEDNGAVKNAKAVGGVDFASIMAGPMAFFSAVASGDVGGAIQALLGGAFDAVTTGFTNTVKSGVAAITGQPSEPTKGNVILAAGTNDYGAPEPAAKNIQKMISDLDAKHYGTTFIAPTDKDKFAAVSKATVEAAEGAGAKVYMPKKWDADGYHIDTSEAKNIKDTITHDEIIGDSNAVRIAGSANEFRQEGAQTAQIMTFVDGLEAKAQPSSGTGAVSITDPNGRAILNAISWAEGTDKYPNNGYNTHFAGDQTSDLSKHPAIIKSGGGYDSDAFGRYQFMSPTWAEYGGAVAAHDGKPEKGGLSMSPENQDKVALRLVSEKRNVDVSDGLSVAETQKLADEWASILGNSHGQGYITPEKFVDKYVEFGGQRQMATGGDVGPNDRGLSQVKLESGEIIFPPGTYGPEIPALNEAVPRFQTGGTVGNIQGSRDPIMDYFQTNNKQLDNRQNEQSVQQPIVVPVPTPATNNATGTTSENPTPSLPDAPGNHIVSTLMMTSYSMMQRIG